MKSNNAYERRIEKERKMLDNLAYWRYRDSPAGKRAEQKNIWQSISVAAVHIPDTNHWAYQGVHSYTKKNLFYDVVENCSIYKAEFFAIVHALAYCKTEGLSMRIYSTCSRAMQCAGNKSMKRNLKEMEENKDLNELVDEALEWLIQNDCQNKVYGWDEINGPFPADWKRS
jgi:ribonuclease HI